MQYSSLTVSSNNIRALSQLNPSSWISKELSSRSGVHFQLSSSNLDIKILQRLIWNDSRNKWVILSIQSLFEIHIYFSSHVWDCLWIHHSQNNQKWNFHSIRNQALFTGSQNFDSAQMEPVSTDLNWNNRDAFTHFLSQALKRTKTENGKRI